MSRYHAVMFDLDGTLADTLADIAAAGNHVLAHFGRPPLPTPRYRYLAGQGAAWLVREALRPADETQVAQGLALLKAFQLQHQHEQTTLYPGIAEMLDALAQRGLKLAVLSNKPDRATQQLIAQRFGRWHFNAIMGQRDDGPLKPDPGGAQAIAQRLAVPVERWLYVGDTRVDMLTAKAAGMFAVGALWGFRDEPELRDAGADAIIRGPGELLGLL